MKNYIAERTKACAEFIVEKNATIRETAKVFGISKSTVYKDISERLEGLDKELSVETFKVIKKNKEERHLRGGASTGRRYKKEKIESKSEPIAQ